MIISIVIPDSTIVVDGEALTFAFDFYPSKLRAIQWNGTSGTKEFITGANIWFDNFNEISDYLDAFNAEKARLAALV